jgi:hypothetical protein
MLRSKFSVVATILLTLAFHRISPVDSSNTFSERSDFFSKCRTEKHVKYILNLKCFDEFCFASCLKCGSTSVSQTFGRGIATTVEGCRFNDKKKPILAIYRPTIDHFMSAYAQITFQGLKRGDITKLARRNKYAHLDIFKVRQQERRLELFIDAMQNRTTRDLIPNVNHAFQLMHFFKELHACYRQEIEKPPLYLIDLRNLDTEWKLISEAENFNKFKLVMHATKHAAILPKAKKRSPPDKSKNHAQYLARYTPVNERNNKNIMSLHRDDTGCML